MTRYSGRRSPRGERSQRSIANATTTTAGLPDPGPRTNLRRSATARCCVLSHTAEDQEGHPCHRPGFVRSETRAL